MRLSFRTRALSRIICCVGRGKPRSAHVLVVCRGTASMQKYTQETPACRHQNPLAHIIGLQPPQHECSGRSAGVRSCRLHPGGAGLSIQFKLSFKLILEEIYTAYRFKAFPSSQRTGGQADGNEELLTLLRRQKSEASPGGQRGTRTEMQRGRMTIVR